jgi:hypothetical protein
LSSGVCSHKRQGIARRFISPVKPTCLLLQIVSREMASENQSKIHEIFHHSRDEGDRLCLPFTDTAVLCLPGTGNTDSSETSCKNGTQHKKIVRTYKKYRRAPKGWPTRQNVTQNTELPKILPARLFIFSRGRVIATSGSWNIIPAKATPILPATVSEMDRAT